MARPHTIKHLCIPHCQHAIDHRAGFAEIIRRIAEFRQGGAVEVLGDFGVLGEEIGLRFCGMVEDEPRPSWNGS